MRESVTSETDANPWPPRTSYTNNPDLTLQQPSGSAQSYTCTIAARHLVENETAPVLRTQTVQAASAAEPGLPSIPWWAEQEGEA